MKHIIFFFILISTTITITAQNADKIIGQWQNEKQTRIIEIYKNNDLYYAKVVSIKDSEKGIGTNRIDTKNHNLALTNRKIIGIDFLMSFSYFTDRNVWKEGQIYNYETGNTYTGKIVMNGDGELDLTGYYGILWFLGRTQTYSRINK